MDYSFLNIDKCNMCNADASTFYVIGKRLNSSQGLNPKKKIGITTTICKCTKCGLVFSNPMPVPKSLDMHYGVPAESYWNDDYFILDDNYFKTQINTFKSIYKNNSFVKALDIGAGIGKCMLSLEKNGISAFGIEPSKPFYDKAISVMNIDENRIINTDIENANFNKEEFDFITFGAVLEHLYNPYKSIEKAMEWLKPNGLIHIEVPYSKWLTGRIINFIYRLRGMDYVANISPMHNPFHLYEFELNSFVKNSKLLNYNIKYHKHMIADTYLPKIMDPLIKPLMRATNTGMQLEVWLKKV